MNVWYRVFLFSCVLRCRRFEFGGLLFALRADVVDADPLTGGGVQDKVLANAPAAEHGFFGVPKVIE